MRIYSISVRNYRPFSELSEVKLGKLATIVGANDVGKSAILQALDVFFASKPAVTQDDINSNAGTGDGIIIEVAFTELPQAIEIEEDVETTFAVERLTDSDGLLRVRKTYACNQLTKPKTHVIVQDYDDEEFAGLALRKETDLNQLGKKLGLDLTRSGRGITNKSKRDAIREVADQKGIPTCTRELELPAKSNALKVIEGSFPFFRLFPVDTRLGIGETGFQREFRSIVIDSCTHPDNSEPREAFVLAIQTSLQIELDEIFSKLQRHTTSLQSLSAVPSFSWEKAVTLDVLGTDAQGICNSLDRRGSGLRRLLMVAFFEHLAEKECGRDVSFVFAVEEPENCLHPALQRDLVRSFGQLADSGHQVIVTSHSPVFAGASPRDDLALVKRNEGIARAVQTPDLELSDVAESLGVEPADQITGYKAVVFVEGVTDGEFLFEISQKLAEAGHVAASLKESGIGYVPYGGSDTLKHWVNMRALGRLNRRYVVVVDSDRKSPTHVVPQRKLNWKAVCEEEGAVFFILRKREIENYLHSQSIEATGREVVAYDDFSDMKKLFGDNVWKAVRHMTAAQVLEVDAYQEDGEEKHELVAIVRSCLELVADSQ